MSGGKIEYGALAKWSRKTAQSKGEKAARSWANEKIVKRIKIV